MIERDWCREAADEISLSGAIVARPWMEAVRVDCGEIADIIRRHAHQTDCDFNVLVTKLICDIENVMWREGRVQIPEAAMPEVSILLRNAIRSILPPTEREGGEDAAE